MSAWFSPIRVASHDTTTTKLQIATIFYHRDGFQCPGVSTYLRRTQLLNSDAPQHLESETMTLSQNIFHASDKTVT